MTDQPRSVAGAMLAGEMPPTPEGAGIALIMSYALAEMAVVHPVAGGFGVYAEKYLNPWAGFSVRATYGVAQIIAIGAEVTAEQSYISFKFQILLQERDDP